MTNSPSSPQKDHKAGPMLFVIMLVIIIGSILLFLILRPKSFSTMPRDNTPIPASQQ